MVFPPVQTVAVSFQNYFRCHELSMRSWKVKRFIRAFSLLKEGCYEENTGAASLWEIGKYNVQTRLTVSHVGHGN